MRSDPIFHFDLDGGEVCGALKGETWAMWEMLLYLDTVVPEELLGQLLEMIHLIHLLTHPTPPHQILILHHLDTVVPEDADGAACCNADTKPSATPPLYPSFAPHPPAPHRTLLPHPATPSDPALSGHGDTVVPEELLGQLLATCFSSAVLLLGSRPGGARGAGCGAEAARGGHGFQHVAVAGRSALAVCSDERVEDLEVLLRAFTRMEATAMVAASLWKRLQGCSRLVAKLLSERALNATDVPSVRPAARSHPSSASACEYLEPDSRTDEWRVVGRLWQEKEPSGSSSSDTTGATSSTPGSSSSSSSAAPPLPPAAAKASGGGRRMGNLLYRHEPTEREVIFTSPAFVIFNTVDEEDAATGAVASRDSVEIVKHQLYAKASLDDLTLALKVAAQE
ncbi:unnamed protein product [Closterium sp. Naga37s-1]|nr:unnamed protein product [Closterium sp. Naga37s-1]